MGTFLDLTGRKFGSLTVLSLSGRRRRHTFWLCRCICGEITEARGSHLTYGQRISCGCLSQRSLKGSRSARWIGHGEISGRQWSAIIKGALQRGIPFDLKIEQAWALFLEQSRLCALSGLPLAFGPRWSSTTASLDRINSQLPYVMSNVQWTHKDINQMKWQHSQEYFVEMCKLVAEHDRRKGKTHG